MDVQLLSGDEAGARLGRGDFAGAWEALHRGCPWATGFQSPAFARAWYASYALPHHPVLQRDGVKSATTCEAGLAREGANPLALPRILDDNRVSQIEFEAEVSGFTELVRRARGRAQLSTLGYPCFVEWSGVTAELAVIA